MINNNDKKVYAFIRNKIMHGQKAPTLKEINSITGKASPRSAVLSLERLEKFGLIRRSGRKIWVNAGVEDNHSISTINLPLVGNIAAGMPILAEENIEAMIPVTSELARPGHKYFLLRVVGDSMNQAKVKGEIIENGCILLVRQQMTADDGQIVVALIDDEATVKVLEKRNGFVILKPQSSNKKHKPIILTANCIIQGVVVGVLPADIY